MSQTINRRNVNVANSTSRWLRYGVTPLVGLAVVFCRIVYVYKTYFAIFLYLLKGEGHLPLRLYTAPFQLKSDLSVKVTWLSEWLQRLGYRALTGEVAGSLLPQKVGTHEPKNGSPRVRSPQF